MNRSGSVTTVTSRYSSMQMRKLTTLQAHALGVLVDVGIADADEIARHLLVDARRLGPVLGGLEKRGLIQRTYTGHRFARHAYYVTGAGEDAYRVEFGGDDADE